MPNIKLDKTCFCGRNYWCEKPGCASDPHKPKPAEPLMPWDDGYEERKVQKVAEPPQAKRATAPTKKIVAEDKAKRAPPQSIRFPQEVLDHFGYKTSGWQKRINDVLTEYARTKRSP